MPISKMVVDKQKSSEAVQAALTTHEEAVVSGIGEVLGPEAGAAVSVVLNSASTRLAQVTATMVTADDNHLKEHGDDAQHLLARDEAADAMYGDINDFKSTGESVLGQGFMQRLGLKGATPRDAVALERLAGLVLDNLKTETPPAPIKRGASLDLGEWVEPLQTKRTRLSETLSQVALERREAEATQVVKNQAIERYNRVFSVTASLLSLLLRIAGEDELADRVRPSSRRAGQTAASETSSQDENTSDTPPLSQPV